MKLTVLFIASIGLMAALQAGCANQSTIAAGNPAGRTYTNQDLADTGRHDTAGAIQAADPSAHTSEGTRVSGER